MNVKRAAAVAMWALMSFANPLHAAEPTMHDVYQAASADRLSDAQSMMQEVLKAHPKSAKAHYVEAEILAKQHDLTSARTELQTAETLAPGLPFAKAQSVKELREVLAREHSIPSVQGLRSQGSSIGGSGNSLPWSFIIAGLGLLGFIVLVSRMMIQRNPPAIQPGPVYGNSGGYASGPAMAPWGGGSAPSMAPTSGGLGSGILGGLATGAAVGAGMVAGEALMHRMIDGAHPADKSALTPAPTDISSFGAPLQDFSANDDMGGTDFGISDTSSWDDDSGGGGSDWL